MNAAPSNPLKLAVCATHLRGIATAVTSYAAQNKRAYPARGAVAGNWPATRT